MKTDVYQMVTDRIVESLNEGIIPWRKSWKGSAAAGTAANYATGRQYRGINIAILWAEMARHGYNHNLWLTYKQAVAKGGQVRKGERGTQVIFWKWLEKEETTESGETKRKRIPFLRYYTVFNVDQCDGLSIDEAPTTDFEPIERCQQIVDDYKGPGIYHDGGDRAFYRPSTDEVHLPIPEAFDTTEDYYGVTFHELAHSTGHVSRLDRGLGQAAFGNEVYSKEELVAELASAFLCAESRIDTASIQKNETAYIQGWLKALGNDPKLVVQAGAQAQKAVDLIVGRSFEDDEKAR